MHLAVGVPPMLRLQGDLTPIKFRDLGEAELESYITEVLTQSQLKVLREGPPRQMSPLVGSGLRHIHIMDIIWIWKGHGATYEHSHKSLA